MEDESGRVRDVSVNGIHMLRTAQQIQVSLSQMADQKASILMGATFVIFTITINQAKSASDPLPLLILGAAAFFSAICTVLAVLPATGGPRRDAPINLLFFGSFTQLGEEDYARRITDVMRSDDAVYAAMARDIYQNGTVLQRKKYRMLGYAYRIFLAGLTLSFLVFVAEFLVR